MKPGLRHNLEIYWFIFKGGGVHKILLNSQFSVIMNLLIAAEFIFFNQAYISYKKNISPKLSNRMKTDMH